MQWKDAWVGSWRGWRRRVWGGRDSAYLSGPCVCPAIRRQWQQQNKHLTRTSHLRRITSSIMSVETINTISPITNKSVVVRNGLSDADLESIPAAAVEAFKAFRTTTLEERKAIVKKALKNIDARKDQMAREITEQMGRPIAYTAKEVSTAVMRGEYLLKVADEALSSTDGEPEKGFKRYIKKVPVGPVLILFPWNVSCFPPAPLPNPVWLTQTVSLPHPHQLCCSCHPSWQLGHPEALPADTHQRRAFAAGLRRGRPPSERHPILPLWIPLPDRDSGEKSCNPAGVFYRFRSWWFGSSARRQRQSRCSRWSGAWWQGPCVHPS